MRFLSPEWLEHMRAATSTASPAEALTVHQRVSGGPDGDVEYTLGLAGGTVSFEPGPAGPGPGPVVELTADYETAVAISQGRLSPAAAFAAGRLQVDGAVASLVAHQDALADIGRLLGGMTEATTY